MGIYDFIDFVSDILDGFLFLAFFCYITEKKTFIKDHILKSLFFISFVSVFTYLINRAAPNLSPFLLAPLILSAVSIVTKSSLFTAFIGMATYAIATLAFELLIGGAICIPLGYKLSDISTSVSSRAILAIIIKSFETVLIFYLYKTRKTLFKFSFFKKENTLITYTILNSFIIVLLGFCYIFIFENFAENSVLDQSLLAMLLVFYFTLTFLDFRERERILQTQTAFIVQKEYVKNLEIVIDVIRKERHDFANHINTLLAMCIIKKPDTLDKIEAYGRTILSKTGSAYKFFDTGNQYVDGLMAVKSNEAANRNLHIDIDFETPLTEVALDDMDLTAILGNILDNAFDAIAMTPSIGNPIVSVYSYAEADKYYISISNNALKIPDEDIKRIFESHFSTKQSDDKDRGFGLYITQELITKNNGRIHVRSDENETEFLLEFKRKYVSI